MTTQYGIVHFERSRMSSLPCQVPFLYFMMKTKDDKMELGRERGILSMQTLMSGRAFIIHVECSSATTV